MLSESFDLLHKPRDAPGPYPTIHKFMTEMCTILLQNRALWVISLMHRRICKIDQWIHDDKISHFNICVIIATELLVELNYLLTKLNSYWIAALFRNYHIYEHLLLIYQVRRLGIFKLDAGRMLISFLSWNIVITIPVKLRWTNSSVHWKLAFEYISKMGHTL